MTCTDRGLVHNKPYCKRYGDYCDIWRLLWCKRDIFFGIFMGLAIAFFAYGIIYAYNYADNRVDVKGKIESGKVAETLRLDMLEQMILEERKGRQGLEKTVVNHWKDLDKKLKELKSKEDVK